MISGGHLPHRLRPAAAPPGSPLRGSQPGSEPRSLLDAWVSPRASGLLEDCSLLARHPGVHLDPIFWAVIGNADQPRVIFLKICLRHKRH